MKATLANYKRSCREYKQNGKAMNQALYDLCKRYPDRKKQTLGGVRAKLWIIGRAYATGIERKIKTDGSQGSSMEQLAYHFWKHRTQVNKIMNTLKRTREPLTAVKLQTIVLAHGNLVRLVSKILRKHQSPRSFVSKYLHFHCPIVPIYDSVAKTSLRKHSPWKKRENFSLRKGADKPYGLFVLRFLDFYHDLGKGGNKVEVKQLDEFLLWLQKRP